MPTEPPLSLTELKSRVVRAFLSLTVRQILLRAISFVSINIILARILPVETLGVFNIATAIITFFAFFSDVGLAASLIQKKEEVSQEDIKTIFTIQLLIVGILSLVILLTASIMSQFYHLDESGVWLIRILGIGFFLSSLKVIPSVLLERKLKFEPLVTVEVVETVIFNGVLIYLAYLGANLWSFSAAALFRGIAGVVLIYLLAPVRVGFQINLQSAKKLLSFGIPFQLNNLLALLKDRLVPLVIAKMIGPVGVGFVTWSQSIAFLPLEIMSMIIRISFPAFSRLQQDRETLSKVVEKSLYLTAMLVYPMIFGIGAILPSVVSFVVSSKWQGAVPSFYLFAISALWATVSTTFTNTLNAIGEVKKTLKLMVMWTVLTWVLTPLAVYYFGFLGVALSSFLISFTSAVTIILVKRILVVRVFNALWLPLLASVLMSSVVFILANFFVRGKFSLILVILFGITFYILLISKLTRNQLWQEIKLLRDV